MKNTIKSLCTIGALALTLLSGTVSSVSAQEKLVNYNGAGVQTIEDAFSISKQKCIDNGWMETSCFTVTEATGSFQIGLIIAEMNSTIESFRERNGWGEEVTLDTVVPIGSTFAFAGRGA
jgi:hypothetical protein